MTRNEMYVGAAVLAVLAVLVFSSKSKDDEAKRKAAEDAAKAKQQDQVGGFINGASGLLTGATGLANAFGSMIDKLGSLSAAAGGGTGAGSSIDDRSDVSDPVFEVPEMTGEVA